MTLNNSPAPLIQQGWLRAIIFCAAYILGTYLIGLIAGSVYAAALISKNPSSVNLQSIMVFSLIVVAAVGITLSIIFRLYIDRKPIVSLGLDRHLHRNDAWTGLLLSIVLLGLGSLILHFAGILNWIDARFSGPDFFMAIMLMLVVSLSEEMVFRGYLLNNLLDSFHKWVALLVSALLFTVAHSFNPNLNAVALINLFLGGLMLGINFIYTRTLWFAIGLHFGWNFIQGYVLGFAVSGFAEQTMLQQELKGHPVMTGNEFGFEGSIVATGLMAAAIGLLYYVYEKKENK
jgi:membrane protease YdiL (CAAX protease family)